MKNGIHAARLDKQEKVRGIIHPHAGLASDLITFDIDNQPDMTSKLSINLSKICLAHRKKIVMFMRLMKLNDTGKKGVTVFKYNTCQIPTKQQNEQMI